MTRTLDRIVDIIDCFSRDRTNASLAEIAELTGLDRATTHRFLSSLERRRVLRRDPETKRFSLGSKLIQWGALAIDGIDVRAAAAGTMRRLQQETGETVALYVCDGTERTCVATLESSERIRHVLPLGSRLRLTQAAGGRALLAAMQPDAARQIIADATDLTRAEREDILRDLPVIRERGYAVGVRLMTPHAWSIAAPIIDRSGEPVAALIIAGPDSQLTEELIDRHGALLRSAAVEVSGTIGAPVSACVLNERLQG